MCSLFISPALTEPLWEHFAMYRSKTNLICYRAFLLWVYYVFSYRALIAELSFFGRTVSGCLRNRFRLRSHRLDDVWKWIMISRLVNPIVATEIARLTIATVYWKWHSLISEVFDCVCSLLVEYESACESWLVVSMYVKENESYGVTSQASFSLENLYMYVSDESGSLEVFVVVSGKTWMEEFNRRTNLSWLLRVFFKRRSQEVGVFFHENLWKKR